MGYLRKTVAEDRLESKLQGKAGEDAAFELLKLDDKRRKALGKLLSSSCPSCYGATYLRSLSRASRAWFLGGHWLSVLLRNQWRRRSSEMRAPRQARSVMVQAVNRVEV